MFPHYSNQTETLKNQRTNQKVSTPSLEHKKIIFLNNIITFDFYNILSK